MYDLAANLPDTDVDPGTNILIAGSPLTGKRQLALEILASGERRGDGSVIVSTKESAEQMLSAFDDHVAGDGATNVGVVDCVTKQRGIRSVEDDPRIKYASSPVDMTGIGIKLSEFLQEFYDERGLTKNRILMHSVSTLLMYSNLQTTFRFLHVLTGRIQSAGALGVYIIESSAHDEQTMNTLKQLFDVVVEVEQPDEEGTTIRTAGLS